MITIAEYIEKLGIGNSILILSILFIIFLSLIYIIQSLTDHLNHSPLREFIAYGNYEVIAKDNDTKEIRVFVVKSINKMNAFEKATKKISDTNNLIFTIQKI